MDLIIGGAYQGKMSYATEKYSLKDEDIYCCEGEALEFKRCIYHLERWSLACVRGGIDPIEYFKNTQPQWSNSIIICEDIFCGVVPIDDDMRQWREVTGRLLGWLSARADGVTRLFCGLPNKLR